MLSPSRCNKEIHKLCFTLFNPFDVAKILLTDMRFLIKENMKPDSVMAVRKYYPILKLSQKSRMQIFCGTTCETEKTGIKV